MTGGSFSVEVRTHPIFWDLQEVACPECQEVRGLTMTAFPQDASTVFRCPNRHVWDRHDVPGRFVKAVYRRIVEDPDASTISIDLEDL